jgi:hypothetical protein
MIVDDIRRARQREDKAHTLIPLHVLHHFLKSHPESLTEKEVSDFGRL